MNRPFSPASERNKEPILQVLENYLQTATGRLLEIGAGTGQHAVYIAPNFPKLKWTMSDQPEHVPNLKDVVKEAQITNLTEPWEFKVGDAHIPRNIFNVVYTANTFHIMGWKECKTLIKSAGGALPENGLFMVYGPFKYNEQFTSPSNEAFDQTLRERDPASGIRSFEDVDRSMQKNGMELVQDHEMPANNRLLVYKRQKFVRK